MEVELRGLEPLTPCMPCKCATNCATAPRKAPPVYREYRRVRAAHALGSGTRNDLGEGKELAHVVSGLLLRRLSGVVLLQPPLAPHVRQQRPSAVAERREPPVQLRLESQQRADRRAGGAAVGDSHQQGAGSEPVQ